MKSKTRRYFTQADKTFLDSAVPYLGIEIDDALEK